MMRALLCLGSQVAHLVDEHRAWHRLPGHQRELELSVLSFFDHLLSLVFLLVFQLGASPVEL